MFNALSSSWTQLKSTSPITPEAAKGACMVLQIPLVYIFGGISRVGCLGELWVFNSALNTFTLLSAGGPALAYAYCKLVENQFVVMFGENCAGEASSNIKKYDFDVEAWIEVEYPPPSVDSAQGLELLMGDTLIRIAGEAWDINSRNQVFLYGVDNTTLVGTIPICIYLAASEYYGTVIYAFGGGAVFGNTLRVSVPVSIFVMINLQDVCANGACEVLCSPGTFQTGNGCTKTSVGYYSEGLGNIAAIPCPPGTYNYISGATSNRQCYPCAEGTYVPNYGSSFCITCPWGFTCPLGSISPSPLQDTPSSSSSQPSLYKPQDIQGISLQYELSVGLSMLFLILISIFWEKLGQNLDAIDLYPALHNHFTKQHMFLNQTFLGGLFSLIFITAALILIGLSIITYELDNITEIKTLVPLVALQSEVSQFVASDATITVDFLVYGDSCGGDGNCGSLISAYFQNVQSNSTVTSCVLIEKTCRVQVLCVSCVFQIGSSLSIVLGEELSYSTGISVNVSSASSIPGTRSAISTSAYPKTGYMFIGNVPTVFFFVLTPSLFESDVHMWPAKETGYHVAVEAATVEGSQFSVFELPINSQLQVSLRLDISNESLFTARMVNQAFLFLISTLLGSVFGIMGTVGATMKFIEKQIIKNKQRNEILNRYRKLNRNRKRIKHDVFDLGFDLDPTMVAYVRRYTTIGTRKMEYNNYSAFGHEEVELDYE